MIRASACLFLAFVVGGAIALGCGSDSDAPAGASPSDAGGDGSPTTDPDGGQTVPEAGCAHHGDDGVEPETRTVDGGVSPLTFIEINGADRQMSLSNDGKLALIHDGATGDVIVYDTAAGTLTKKATTGDPGITIANALSGDGQTIAAYQGKDTIYAGRWDSCNGWIDAVATGGCAGSPENGNPNTETSGFDLNYDGTVMVGSAWNGCKNTSAMRWTLSGSTWTPLTLQHFGIAGGSSRASFVSDDGNVIGGFSQYEAADRVATIWKADGTGTVLEPTGQTISEVLAISHDGKMAAGPWNGISGNGGFYWTEVEGAVPVAMPDGSVPEDQMWFNAIAGDNNRLMFGAAGDQNFFNGGLGSMEQAIVWTKADGIRKLGDIIATKGITLPTDWYLVNVTAASADGSVLLGYAVDMGGLMPSFHTFVLKLDPAAY